MKKINFREVKDVLRGSEYIILRQLLPNGKREGHKFVALNPTREDKNLGSFRININSWKWADFATNDRGSDIISLYAYIKGINQLTAAKELIEIGGRIYD